jgi:tRNA/rRNA methyltransferase
MMFPKPGGRSTMKHMETPLSRIRIVLVRPKFASNVGAVARVLANTGLSQLVLVAPQSDPLSTEARKPSARAESILRSARQVDELAGALDGAGYTVGTSCRGGLYREQIELAPEAVAAEAVSRARRGPVVILFGPEDNGLTNEELLRCDAVLRIPSADAYPSLNLAQAAMVVTYERFRAASSPRAPAGPDGPPAGPKEAPADAALMDRLMQQYRRALLKIGYLHPENPEHLLFPLRAVLSRAQPTRKEAQILLGMAQQIEDFAERHAPSSPGPAAGGRVDETVR